MDNSVNPAVTLYRNSKNTNIMHTKIRLTLIIVITVEATPQNDRPRSQSGRPRSADKTSRRRPTSSLIPLTSALKTPSSLIPHTSDLKPSKHKPHVVDAELRAEGAHVRLAAARAEHHHHVRRRGRSVVPTLLNNRHHLAPAVARAVTVLLSNEAHIGLEVTLRRDVAVVHRQPVVVHPAARAAPEKLATRANALGVDVALGILPTPLKDDEHLGLVVALEMLLAAHAAAVGAPRAGRNRQLVVVAQGLGPLRVGNAHLHLRVRVRRRLDRLYHLAQKYRARDHHVHIDDAYRLAVLHHRGELGAAVARRPLLGEHGVANLGHTHNLGHNVRAGPRRAARVGQWLVAANRRFGPYGVAFLPLAAYDVRLLDVARYPRVEIPERYHFHPLGRQRESKYKRKD